MSRSILAHISLFLFHEKEGKPQDSFEETSESNSTKGEGNEVPALSPSAFVPPVPAPSLEPTVAAKDGKNRGDAKEPTSLKSSSDGDLGTGTIVAIAIGGMFVLVGLVVYVGRRQSEEKAIQQQATLEAITESHSAAV